MECFKERIDLYCKKSNDRLLNIALVILSILTILAFARLALFESVLVVKTSMLPTINDGQTVTILKTQNVQRGDIIVFNDSSVYNEILIKRVIGVEGDTVSISEDGILHLTYAGKDGDTTHKAIKEKYILNDKNIEIDSYTVPKGCLYVLGDNRILSYDSSEFGAIQRSSIIGKVIKK